MREVEGLLWFALRLLWEVLYAPVAFGADFGILVDNMGTNSKRSMQQPGQ